MDPDQDLQTGSKLFTWYDVCCNIRGGGGGGFCPSCKIQRRDYVLVVKFSGGGGGGLCPSCNIHGGDFVHVYKNEQGGFVRGGGGDFVLHSFSTNASMGKSVSIPLLTPFQLSFNVAHLNR